MNRGRPSSPALWVDHGSSDPFDCFPVEVTPTVNRVISLARDCYLPALYIPRFLRKTMDGELPASRDIRTERLLGARSVWRNFEVGFSTPETAVAWISSHTTEISRLLSDHERPEFDLAALKIRTQALCTLRAAVAREAGGYPSMAVVQQIMWLFRSECVEGRVEGAQTHANIIRYVGEAVQDPEAMTSLFIIAMYNDAELACSRFQKTLLDFDTWLPSRMNAFWSRADPMILPRLPTSCGDLHESIKDVTIRGICTHIKRSLAVQDLSLNMETVGEKAYGDMVFQWMGSHMQHDIGVLINYAVDLLQLELEDHNEMRAERYLTAALALTTLYWLRKYTQEATLNGVDLRDASHVLVPRLQQALELFDCNASILEKQTYGDALFWMYFTGAHWEQAREDLARRRAVPLPPDSDYWFSRKLAEHAYRLGLTQRSKVRELLQQFIFNDIMNPHPSQWYLPVIHKYGPQEGGVDEPEDESGRQKIGEIAKQSASMTKIMDLLNTTMAG